MAQRKKLAWPLRSSQLLLAVERLVANDGWVTSRVKAVSRRRRGPQARLYRACHPAILDHRGRRLTPATLLPPPSMRGFTPPVTIFGARHLRRVLAAYSASSLDKDAPSGRRIQRHGVRHCADPFTTPSCLRPDMIFRRDNYETIANCRKAAWISAIGAASAELTTGSSIVSGDWLAITPTGRNGAQTSWSRRLP